MVEALEYSLMPASDDELKRAVKRAYLDGIPRSEGQGDTTARMASLLGHLQQYPRDVVLDALQNFHKSNKWQPNIHDLEKEMDWRTKARRVKLHALMEAETHD